MTSVDLPAVCGIAAEVHPDFPEDDSVFVERLALYPEGCHVLAGADGLAAYVVSHPWLALSCPPLNALLGSLPADAASYYIHDVALTPAVRGAGHATDIVAALASHAATAGFAAMSLVAVNGSMGFWQRHGFASEDMPGLAAKLASYGDDARFMVRALT
ncbi:MAG: GNAT family N-acetyltransferase [Phreatobacter sp.]|uniref:GNAT family N-acetyltransferase n=1 Tax=Phreatobacter sp. TaxID=1966341 RepID=UPI00273626B2|nr:GNAT family N-acetyltransferase [Phreatobacter sp.]MDP2800953.1 GNAT family N-acetyltransferase [Phreatobacter sp.]